MRILLSLILVTASQMAFGIQSIALSDENHSYELNTEWNLVLNQFLTYQEVLEDKSAVSVKVPGTWNNVQWDGEEFSGQGFGTYYLKIKLGQKLKHLPLALEMPDVGLAYRIYANDRWLGEVGKVGKTMAQAEPKLKTELFYIPESHSDELYLIVHVSNYWHQSGGLWFAPKIGAIKTITAARNKQNNIVILVLGGVFIIGIYHLYLYLRRRKEKYGLYFFGICCCLLAQSLTKGDIPIVTFFPEIGWLAIKRLEYISLFCVAWLNTAFIFEAYPGMISKRFKEILTGLSLIAGLFTLVVSPAISFYLILPFQLLTIGTGVYLIFGLVRAVKAKQTGSVLLLIGLTVTFFTVVNDILNSHYVISTFLMVHFGMLIYILTLSLVLAKRFTSALNSEETLTHKLEKLNLQLEERVEKRTAQLKQQKELLEHAHDEQKHLMAIVAHDLMAPLNKILGLSGLIKEDLKPELSRFNDMISNVANEGRRLIEDLVNLHAYERNDFKVDKKNFNFNLFINEKVNEFSNEASAKDITISAELTDQIESIHTDKELLGRIVDNLLSNAIKFSPKGRTISISNEQEENWVILRILDQGPGFSEKDKEMAFRKFQRLSARPTAGENSTGLGLSIVRTLLDKLGGSVELKSMVGEGSEFIIRLPLANTLLV